MPLLLFLYLLEDLKIDVCRQFNHTISFWFVIKTNHEVVPVIELDYDQLVFATGNAEAGDLRQI